MSQLSNSTSLCVRWPRPVVSLCSLPFWCHSVRVHTIVSWHIAEHSDVLLWPGYDGRCPFFYSSLWMWHNLINIFCLCSVDKEIRILVWQIWYCSTDRYTAAHLQTLTLWPSAHKYQTAYGLEYVIASYNVLQQMGSFWPRAFCIIHVTLLNNAFTHIYIPKTLLYIWRLCHFYFTFGQKSQSINVTEELC